MTQEEEIVRLVPISNNKADICRALKWPAHGSYYKRIDNVVKKHSLDTSHFRPNKAEIFIKYPKVTKQCPVCQKSFDTYSGSPKEQRVCSRGCSNTLYRSGENNGNWKKPEDRVGNFSEEYRKLFHKHELICSRCNYSEFDCSVQIHHIDHNRCNNDRANLIPLCANCHLSLHNGKWDLQSLKNC